MGFGLRFLRMLPKLMEACQSVPEDLPDDFDARSTYTGLTFADLWEDADMESVLVYLKGNTSLKIPQHWRPILTSTG